MKGFTSLELLSVIAIMSIIVLACIGGITYLLLSIIL